MALAPHNAATSGVNKGKLLTGADGTYTAVIGAKALGETATVTVSKAGMSFVPASLDAPAHAGAAISGIDFAGFLHATIRGRVKGPDGNAMGGVTVTATNSGSGDVFESVTSTGNARGTYVLSVPFGTYVIEASADGYTFSYTNNNQTVSVAPGQQLSFGDIQATALPPANNPPRFTSGASFDAAEGQTAIGTVTAVDSDPEDDVTGYAITGGADMDKLSINASSGVLTFDAAPDFETPGDADGDNSYDVTVQATSGVANRVLTETQDISVNVTDVDESLPRVTLVLTPASITEDGGVSRISATVDKASAEAFTVTVSAAAVAPAVAGDFILSNNMILSFAANAESSTGAVSITAVDNDDYAADKTVTVSGSVSSTDVTAPAGVTLTIEEDDDKPPAEATLSALSLSGVDAADLGFDPATMTYAVSVANEIAETTVDATASEGATVAAILPVDADDMTAGHQVALGVGDTEITVVVTAPGGKRADYAITVTRMESSDASLSSVMVNGTEIMTEADGTYATSVGNDVEMATVAATATHADATVAFSGTDADATMDGHQVALNVGANEVTITVTAANGTSTMAHTLTVTRGQSSDASLASFSVGDMDIMADETDGTYTHTVGTDDMQVTVSATAGHADAMAEITSPADADDMTDGHQVDLAVGDTEVMATVTAQDGSTMDYTLTISRPAAPAIVVSMAEISVTEGQGDNDGVTYMVSLATQPTADVTVAIETHTDDDGTADDATAFLRLSATSRMFTPSNWNVAQDVKITALEDNSDTDGHEVTLRHVATSTDLNYGDDPATTGPDENESKTANVAVTVVDDDANTPAITVDPATLSIAEDADVGGTFTVVLGAGAGDAATGRPVGGDVSVTIPVPATAGFSLSADESSTDEDGNLVLTFTAANFRTEQTVTVTPVNDEIQSQTPGSEAAVTITATATGGGYDDEADGGGTAVTAPTGTVSVTITEDDAAGVTVSATSLQLLEGGDAGTYTVSLNSDPGGDVTFSVISENNAAAAVSPPAFTLNSSNREQVVTVTPGTVAANVDNITITNAVLSAPSGNGYSSATDVANVTVNVLDNETAQVLVTPTALSIVQGGTGTYEVRLVAAPGADETVTITVASTIAGVNIASDAVLTFTASDYNVAQTVTIAVPASTAARAGSAGDVTNTLTTTATTGGYSAVTAGGVEVTVTAAGS